MKKPIYVGGQAVIEGVMMRGPEYIATAVRTPSGEITVKKDPIRSVGVRHAQFIILGPGVWRRR